MTRIELLKSLCETADELQKLAHTYGSVPLETIVDRLDTLINACVRTGMEPLHKDDTSPCPHCGQEVCTLTKDTP